jgi:hypothetical protein
MSMVAEQLPTLLGDAIGSTPEAGALILAFSVMLMVGLVLSTLKLEGMGVVFIMAVLAGVFTAMEWIPLGLFIVAVIVAVAFLLFGGSSMGAKT